jgi:transposase InsO family protein
MIPEIMQKDILSQLHTAHQGIEKTRHLARQSVYWLGINKHIESMCKTCQTCQKYQPANQKEPIIAHEIPSQKWQFISTDLFYLKGKTYLIIVDRFSKYPLVDEITEPVTSNKVTQKIKFYCGLFGKPTEIMSDGGTQYTGQAFQEFVEKWEIKHTKSSPHYAQSNGFVNKYVGYVKNTLKKSIETGNDLDQALLTIRATPINAKLPSPAQIMLGTRRYFASK